MDSITNTRLWNTTLASKSSSDPVATAREKLRVCFLSLRERAGLLAAEIHRDLPEFTVHDISHLDALWEIADIVTGAEFNLTPPEGFVLGGAFLLHDLGMSLAAYPHGIEDLKQRQTWNDTIALQFMEKYNRQPTAAELAAPSPEAVTAATAFLLRALHAEQAERLGMAAWSLSGTNSSQYLIQDADIRQTYGRIVGLVAHSHWWPVQELEQRFPRPLGAPYWCPKEWTVDPLKLACVLRLADAGHIDARRAPFFLRAIRHISVVSADHWAFQQRIGKPHLSGDALSYTSGCAFHFDESASWWLCFDTLRMIDGELRAVDALLADKGMNRFAARRIAGIESPERLISYIPTAGWMPVDACIQVSDVPRLLTCLGGKELYGRDLKVPLRELVQNSADALRARWAIEGRPEGWGQVSVRLGKDGNKHWLEVEDSGIGMSATVLTKYLLDFSTTFWGSSAMIDELPGLLGSGFRPTGKYGIGFFSIFMLGDSVRIRTRRADAAQKDTLVLEFNTGLSSRPVLREAASDEMLRDGGSCIRVWLRTDPTEQGGLLYRYGDNPVISLDQLCREVCPALPVTLVCHQDNSMTPVVRGSDWLDCPGKELFKRTCGYSMFEAVAEYYDRDACQNFITKAAANLRILQEADGTVVGRACIGLDRRNSEGSTIAGLCGVVTVGGLTACRLNGIAGVLTGTSERAARDNATPVVSSKILSSWATEQASLVAALYENPKDQISCATIVRKCGGDTLDLPIAMYAGSYVSFNQIARISLPDEVILIDFLQIMDFERQPGFKLCPNIFITEYESWQSLLQPHNFYDENYWPYNLQYPKGGIFSAASTIGGSVIEAIAKSWGASTDDLMRQTIDQSNQAEVRVIGHINSQEIESDILFINRVKSLDRDNPEQTSTVQ